MEELDFTFAPTLGGDVTGINDPVTTTFKTDISYSLARESIQNIIDASDPFSNEPAKAEFELFEKTTSQLPKMNSLMEVLTQCKNFYSKNPDAVKFFEKGILAIQNNRFIKILKISDYNTLGLSGGDDDPNGNYFSLMKAVGSSSKSGASGGSFGLGKGAYYAASSFRTVFVSSIYDKDKFVFQGKARLAGFKRDNQFYQGNGSYGFTDPNQSPVRNLDLIPTLFRRTNQGTDFFIIGFEQGDEWKEQMIKSILNYFWLALHEGSLEINVQGTEINKSNLEELLGKYFSENDIDKKDSPNPWPYYRAFTENSHTCLSADLETLGKVELYILKNEGYPRRVSLIRNTGMVIEKRGVGGSMDEYAGVFICRSEEGNEILRKMENPEHNEWKKGNARESADYFELAKKAEKELKDFLSTSIAALSKQENMSSSDVPGLERFLSLPENDDLKGNGKSIQGNLIDDISQEETGTEFSLKSQEESSSKINTRNVTVINEVDKAGEGDEGKNQKEGSKSKKGSGRLQRNPDDTSLGYFPLSVTYRSFSFKDTDNIIKHKLIIKGPRESLCKVEIFAVTDSSLIKMQLKSAKSEKNDELQVNNNTIDGVSFDSEGVAKLLLDFDSNDKYSLSIDAYENK